MRRFFARLRRQDGMTIAEVSVSAALMLVVIAVFGSQLTTAMRATTDLGEQSQALDEAKIAFDRIEREVRAAVEIATPTLNASGDVLEMTTYTGTGGVLRWKRYTIDADGTLLRADGGSGFAATPTWGTPVPLAEHVVATGSTFTSCPKTATRDLATVLLDIQVQVDDDHSPRQLQSEVAIRNTTGSAEVAAGACS